MYFKNGAYRYLIIENGKQRWITLHKQKHKAIARYYELTGETKIIITMNDLIDKYMIEVAVKKAEVTYKGNIKQSVNLKMFFGDMPPEAVTPVDVYAYLEIRGIKAKKPSVRGANLEKALLSHVFTKAIEWGVVKLNPCRDVRKLKEKRKTYTPPLDDFWKIHSIAPLTMKRMMEFCLVTGLRRTDLTKIDKTKAKPEGLEVYINKTKEWVLFEWEDDFLDIYKKSRLIKKMIGSIYLFTNKKGVPYTPSGLSCVLKKLVKKAIATGLIQKSFAWHGIRRLGAKLAEARGGREGARRFLNHKTQQMTAVYLNDMPVIQANKLPKSSDGKTAKIMNFDAENFG